MTTLTDLENRYDGHIPAEARARLDPDHAFRQACASVRFWADQVVAAREAFAAARTPERRAEILPDFLHANQGLAAAEARLRIVQHPGLASLKALDAAIRGASK